MGKNVQSPGKGHAMSNRKNNRTWVRFKARKGARIRQKIIL